MRSRGCLQFIQEEHINDDQHWALTGSHAGLPALALAGYTAFDPNGSWGSMAAPTVRGLKLQLPLLPLWPGFLADTALYGGLAFAVWSAPGFVRRRSRRRRGACVRCGYDLNGTGGAVCPECGGER